MRQGVNPQAPPCHAASSPHCAALPVPVSGKKTVPTWGVVHVADADPHVELARKGWRKMQQQTILSGMTQEIIMFNEAPML